MQNFSCENEFHLHENEPVGGTRFHMSGFARRLVLIRHTSELGNGLLAYQVALSDYELFGKSFKTVRNVLQCTFSQAGRQDYPVCSDQLLG